MIDSSSLSHIVCMDDLRELHRRRVPKMFFDYCESGSWTQSTLAANRSDLRHLLFRQRVALDIAKRSTATQILGADAAMPVVIAPTGLAGMQWADGEILGALAAKQFKIPFTLSTMSTCSMEDVSVATNGHPFMFQLYVLRDRGFVESLIDRAKAIGCSALQITLDLQIMGQRHQDVKNGMSADPRLTLRNILNFAAHPHWCLAMLKTKRRGFGNIIGHAKGVTNVRSLATWTNQQFDPSLSWNDVEWIKRRWGGKIVLKGITHPEDARRAVECGADAIVVSNHGGRQLDGAPSAISVLPKIVDSVQNQCQVWMDGGIMSGQDVLRATALGAQSVMIGRAWLHGLGAGGYEGVLKALQMIQKELDLTMAFCGCTALDQVNKNILEKYE